LNALRTLYGEEEFDDWVTNKLKGVCGVSAGAIVALMVVLNDSMLKDKYFFKKIDANLFLDANISSLVEKRGLLNGSIIKAFVDEVLSNSSLSTEISLEKLFALTKKRFVCLSTDLCSGQVVVLSHESTPNMKVKDAIVSSCSIPILFQPLEYENMLLVDGAFLEVVPLSVYPPDETVCFFVYKGKNEIPKETIKSSFSSFLSRLVDVHVTNNSLSALSSRGAKVMMPLLKNLSLQTDMTLLSTKTDYDAFFRNGFYDTVNELRGGWMKSLFSEKICQYVRIAFCEEDVTSPSGGYQPYI
jgi:predicted acylesterase/phospholipase RssA